MRAKAWLGVGMGVALALGAGCRKEPVPPQMPRAPRGVDTSDMPRAGLPEQQGLPTGNTGEGPPLTSEPPRPEGARR